jgi:tRNA 2-selenouridine synthase
LKVEAFDGVRPGAFLISQLVVLRGETGTGKTDILAALAGRGAQVLDLEALAGHRGSAFGGLGLGRQPSHRAFQARVRAALCSFDRARPVYLEHEGAYIGAVGLPAALVEQMAIADGIRLRCAIPRRAERIAAQYRGVALEELEAALGRVERRLGPDLGRTIRALLREGRLVAAVEALLPYYDQAYQHQLAAARGRILASIDSSRDADEIAEELLRAGATGWRR